MLIQQKKWYQHVDYSASQSKMISRRQGRGDAGVFFIRRGADCRCQRR